MNAFIDNLLNPWFGVFVIAGALGIAFLLLKKK